MKKNIIFVALMAATGSANAVLTNGSTLNLDDGSFLSGEGSFFTLGGGTRVLAPGFDGQLMSNNDGLVLGTVQTPSGSHPGNDVLHAGELPTVNKPADFLLGVGASMNGTESASNVLSASGNTATVDLSGWVMAWNTLDAASGNPTIPLGSGAWFENTTDGVAQVTCGIDCGDGDTYTLIYSATIPAGDPSSIGSTQYYLHLSGTITAVPVPAAVWLFGSGLLGLAGIARRRKVA